MRRNRGHLFWVVYFFLLAAGSAALASAAWNSVTNYRPRHAFRVSLPGGEPLAERVVLIVLDGIRLDVSQRMEFLQRLGQRGASGVVRSVLPSLSSPNRAAMVTGARPEINGITSNGHYRPPPVDSVLSLAREAGLRTAVAGSIFWWETFGEFIGAPPFRYNKDIDIGAGPAKLIAWQRQTCARTVEFVRSETAELIVTAVTAADPIGHDFGGESEAYIETAQAVDACIERLVEALDAPGTAFVVVSDHGQIDRRGRGGHGGNEEEVLRVPLVLAGAGIASSVGFQAEMLDVAPTICALLGLPLPATNQGRILWETIEAPAELEAALRQRERQQHELAQRKLPGREQGRIAERAKRGAAAIGALTLFAAVGGWVLFGSQSPRLPLLLAAGAHYAAYYFLFWVFGLGYSLSAIGREEYLYSFLAKSALGTVAAFACASRLFSWRTGRPWALSAVEPALLLTSVLGLEVTAIYYHYGLIMRDFMLDLNAGLYGYLNLLQIAAVSVMAATSVLGGWVSRASPEASSD